MAEFLQHLFYGKYGTIFRPMKQPHWYDFRAKYHTWKYTGGPRPVAAIVQNHKYQLAISLTGNAAIMAAQSEELSM